MNTYKRWIVGLVLLLAVGSPIAVLGQDTPATPETTYDLPDLDTVVGAEPEPVDVEVNDGDVVLDDTTTPIDEPDVPLSFFMQGALTLVIVAIIKRLPPLANVPAPSLTVLVAFVIWGIFQWARARGYADQFNAISDHLVILLPAITEIILSLLGATGGFLLFRAANFPLLGYSRS